MSKYLDSIVECPFYVEEGSCSITCEGLIQGAESTHIFKNNSMKVEHIVNVCGKNCGKSCYHYRMLSQLYERGLRV